MDYNNIDIDLRQMKVMTQIADLLYVSKISFGEYKDIFDKLDQYYQQCYQRLQDINPLQDCSDAIVEPASPDLYDGYFSS